MSYISSVEFQAIALACDELHVDLRGVVLVDSNNRIDITTEYGTTRVIRYGGMCPFTYQAYVEEKLENSPGKHYHGTPAVQVMMDAWLEGLLSDRPVRTPLERELGVIYG